VALNTPPYSTEVKERIELYLYSSLGLRGIFYGELYFYIIELPYANTFSVNSSYADWKFFLS
jgi:hypothetical protein